MRLIYVGLLLKNLLFTDSNVLERVPKIGTAETVQVQIRKADVKAKICMMMVQTSTEVSSE